MGKEAQTPKEVLVKARLYRMAAFLFAIIGVLLFVVLYVQHVDGDLVRLFSNIRMITIFLMPFLPAAVLSLLSKRLEKKYFNMVGKGKTEQG